MNKSQNNAVPKAKPRDEHHAEERGHEFEAITEQHDAKNEATRCSSRFCSCKERGHMKLDNQRVLSLFALFTDLPDSELADWVSLCNSAEAKLSRLLRKRVDIPKNMERLCNAAAAIAYCDYAMLAGGAASGDIRVGEISLKAGGDANDAISTRDYMLAEISDLLAAPSGFVFRGMGKDGHTHEKMF